ncbi:hypothetical protein JVU11DRAFT_4241 [Chiua virens]|nr:hypothetical protein JVU11DRAFT_4241 [Chiua virens]
MLGETLPLLSCAVPTFKVVIVQWEHLKISAPYYALFIDIGLVFAKGYYDHMRRTHAHAIVMFIDPTIHFTWMEMNWKQNEVTRVKGHILELIEKYHMVSNPEHFPAVPCPAIPTGYLASQYGLLTLYPQHPQTNTQTISQEFILYVMASCSPEGTDPLSFWAVSQLDYILGQQ